MNEFSTKSWILAGYRTKYSTILENIVNDLGFINQESNLEEKKTMGKISTKRQYILVDLEYFIRKCNRTSLTLCNSVVMTKNRYFI